MAPLDDPFSSCASVAATDAARGWSSPSSMLTGGGTAMSRLIPSSALRSFDSSSCAAGGSRNCGGVGVGWAATVTAATKASLSAARPASSSSRDGTEAVAEVRMVLRVLLMPCCMWTDRLGVGYGFGSIHLSRAGHRPTHDKART